MSLEEFNPKSQSGSQPANLTVVQSTDIADIIETLKGKGPLHVTNGTYAAPANIIVPTSLTGFEYLANRVASTNDVFVIAINSHDSMQRIYDKKIVAARTSEDKAKLEQERQSLEPQEERALKVAGPLALQHARRNVVVVFYDDETPTSLYEQMQAAGLPMASLHKWGYGTNPSQSRIEGAHCFEKTYGFPLPNDQKPLCHDITGHGETAPINVEDLRVVTGSHGAPYINPEGALLFPLRHPDLAKYGDHPHLRAQPPSSPSSR